MRCGFAQVERHRAAKRCDSSSVLPLARPGRKSVRNAFSAVRRAFAQRVRMHSLGEWGQEVYTSVSRQDDWQAKGLRDGQRAEAKPL